MSHGGSLAIVIIALMTALTISPAGRTDAAGNHSGKPDKGYRGLASRVSLDTPLAFIENRGQMDSRILYHLQGRETAVSFTRGGLIISISGRDPGSMKAATNRTESMARRRWNLALDFVDANPEAVAQGRDPLPARVSYFTGPRKDWHTGIGTYSKVVYRNLWPGIDLVYSGTQDRLKYEFIVNPGADPHQIKLAYRGASGDLAVNPQGQLEVPTPMGIIRDDRPVSYQGSNRAIETRFIVDSQGDHRSYGFKVGKYDRRKKLVIDPAILVYAGFIGGSGDDEGHSVAVDNAGNAYVTGVTTSSQATFPETVGPGLSYTARTDVFVAKIKADGTGLDYAGYIGGDGDEAGHGIGIDSSGNAYLTGWTSSSEATFPVLVGPVLVYKGSIDAFIAKVNPTGSSLIYCGYLGGDDQDEGMGIAVDTTGRALVTGLTASNETTFPVLVGPDMTFNGAIDAFAARVKADGTGFEYAGYLGGSGDDQGRGIVVDGPGNAYVGGLTTSSEATFPMVGALDPTFNGGTDAFIAKIDTTGSAITYSGFIGGAGIDEAFDIALDPAGNAYLTGRTTSSEATFPKLVGPDLTYNGAFDAFAAKVNAAGSALLYAGYIGGSGDDEGFSIATDSAGNAYVTGRTTSGDSTFPELNGFDLTLDGASDGFLAMVANGGAFLNYAVYLGGSGEEEGFGVAVRGFAQAYVAGRSTTVDGSLPVVTGPALVSGGASDAFVIGVDADFYEADVAPRPNGSRTLVVSDWVQVGRFSVGLDVPAPGSEFQRADCAPRNTMGDGKITVADWVQAGRYSVGLDSLLVSGGPTQMIAGLLREIKQPNTPRELRVASRTVTQDGDYIQVPVDLQALGGENALAFSISYDPSILRYEGFVNGRDAGQGMTVLAQERSASEGKLGYALALKPGGKFNHGVREVLTLRFKVIKPFGDRLQIGIGDGIVPLELVDVLAGELSVRPVAGSVRLIAPIISGESETGQTERSRVMRERR